MNLHRALAAWRSARVDAGVVVQRIEVIRDGLRTSYLGPPESPRR